MCGMNRSEGNALGIAQRQLSLSLREARACARTKLSSVGILCGAGALDREGLPVGRAPDNGQAHAYAFG
jgi:hypothetical protein